MKNNNKKILNLFLALEQKKKKINVYLYIYVGTSTYTLYVCELLHFENHAVLRKEIKKSKKKTYTTIIACCNINKHHWNE